MCFKEKIHVLGELCLGMVVSVLLARSSMLMNQQCTLNKMSLSRNTCEIKLCMH